MSSGFVVMAENTADTDYVECAEMLAASIKRHMPNQSVTLITDSVTSSLWFDQVVRLPYGDQCLDSDWKLANDWQVYAASPYEYTIKIEADILLPRSIEHWWGTLMPHDLVISTTARNFKNEIASSMFYRKTIEDNKLPNTYNALTYFKKSQTAARFYEIVRTIFENWAMMREVLTINPAEPATTDVVYAIAASIIGEEKTTLPFFTDMSMIHMKQQINKSSAEDWTKEFVYEIHPDSIRVNTVPQLYPFHYQQKHFAQEIKRALHQ